MRWTAFEVEGRRRGGEEGEEWRDEDGEGEVVQGLDGEDLEEGGGGVEPARAGGRDLK